MPSLGTEEENLITALSPVHFFSGSSSAIGSSSRMKTYGAVLGELSMMAIRNHAMGRMPAAAARGNASKGSTRIERVARGRSKKNANGALNRG